MPLMRYKTTLLLLFVAAGTAAADFSMSSLAGEPLSVDEAELAQAHLGVYWRLTLPLRPAEQVTLLSLVDEHIYAVTDRGELFAVRAESGRVHWQRSIIEAGGVVFPPTHSIIEGGTGPIVVTTPGWVARLDRETGRELPFVDIKSGKELARLSLRTPPNASIVANAESLYASLVDNRFACYQLKDGLFRWAVGLNAPGFTTPRLLPDWVLVASNQGRFWMFSADRFDLGEVLWTNQMGTAPLEPVLGLTSEERRNLWPREAGTRPLEPIFLSREDLIFTGADQTVYSVDPRTGPVDGQYRWRHSLSSRPSEGPVVVGDLVFQPDPRRGVVALDRRTGQARWFLPRGRRLSACAGSRVYVWSTDGRLLVADRQTGRVQSRIPLAGVHFAPTDAVADAAYLANQRGQIVCIRNRDAEPLERDAFLPRPQPTTTQAAGREPTTSRAPDIQQAPAETQPSVRTPFLEGDVLHSERP